MSSELEIYMNSGYNNKRNRKRTLILDINDNNNNKLGEGKEFQVTLFEPLIIDKHSEIYLDNFLSFNSNIGQTVETSSFLLKINEFKMNSNVASTTSGNHIFNSLIIPNEHKTVSNNHSTVIHKGKKFNYVCDINPQTIYNLSGKITDLDGKPMFHGPYDHTFTYSLSGIKSGKLDNIVYSGNIFENISIGGVDLDVKGCFLATHFSSSTTLHFATNQVLPNNSLFISGGGDITFVMEERENLTLTNGAEDDNPNLTLVTNPGRFIAEFSILSRE